MVVHTDQDITLGRFGGNGVYNRRVHTSSHAARVRAEVHVITFQKRRPVRCEHPFDATTNRPAGPGVRGLATSKRTAEVCTCMSPCSAALKVEQPGGLYSIAEAGRQGVKPLIIEVHHGACEWTSSDCSAFIVACVIKQFAETDHKYAAELVIAANLTTTSKARTVSRDFSARGTSAGVAKCPANVAADVAAGPGRRWSHHYWLCFICRPLRQVSR